MASALRAKVNKLTGSSTSPESHSRNNSVDPALEAEKYKLMVTAGPSYDQSQHTIVAVNTDQHVEVENEFLRAKIKVRVRGFGGRGLPSTSPPSSKYFADPVHEKDQYSIAFSFVPKQDLKSEDTVWGNDFDHPIRNKLPPGFNVAFKIVKEFIDPGLNCDAYADEPWLYGPSLSCWFAFRIGDVVEESQDFPAPEDEEPLHEGADGSGNDVRRQLSLPENNDRRRKYFLSLPHRQAFTFEKGRVYQGDFYNPYIDFPNFSLKLPGFSMKVIKYVDQKSHCLRYVFKNRKSGEVYFNVNFHLLWGEELQKAIKEDEEQRMQERAQKDNGAAKGQVNGHSASEPNGANNVAGDTSPSVEAPPTSAATVCGSLSGGPAWSADSPQAAAGAKAAESSNAKVHVGEQKAAGDKADADAITKALEDTATSDGRKDGWTHMDDDVD